MILPNAIYFYLKGLEGEQKSIIFKKKKDVENLSMLDLTFLVELSVYEPSRLYITKDIELQFKYKNMPFKDNQTSLWKIDCAFNVIQKASIYQSTLIHKEHVSDKLNGILDYHFNCQSDESIEYQAKSNETLEQVTVNLLFPEKMEILIKKNEIQKFVEYSPYLIGFGILYFYFFSMVSKLLKEANIIS